MDPVLDQKSTNSATWWRWPAAKLSI